MSDLTSEPPRSASRRYWTDRLLECSSDRARLPRAAAYDGRGGADVIRVPLSSEVDAALRGVTRSSPFLAYVVIASASAVALYRDSGCRNVMFAGAPTKRPAERSNALVHRLVVDPSRSFRDTLESLRAAMLEADGHRHYPFALLLEALGLSIETHDLFDVLLTHAALHDPPASCGERVSVRIDADDRGTTLAAAFDARMVAADAVSILIERTIAVLGAGLASPHAPLATLDLVGPRERRRIVSDWHPAVDTSDDAMFDLLVARQAAASPARVAAVDAGSGASLTYADLDREVSHLAAALTARPLKAEEVVGICVPASPSLIVAVLAVWRAGAACVLLDPSTPPRRVRGVVDDAKVRVVIASALLRERMFGGGALRVIAIDEDCHGATSHAPAVPRDPRQLAYVMYTSGSTGRPKGVMVEHRSLANYLRWAVRAYRLDANACVPLTSSPAFDLALTALLAPLACGGCVVLGGELQTLDGLHRALDGAARFSLIKATPSHVLALGDALGPATLRDAAPTLVFGGGPLRESHVARWRAAAPGVRLFNEYGPTEATVGCSVFESGAPDPSGLVPIGRSAANARLYLLDADLEPVPDGVPGELYVGGPCLARGYVGQPAETAVRFVPDPFSPEAGGRMYRTADLAVRRDDGNLMFLGRSDRQVKVRGYRIELAEIEAALLGVPGVKAAAAAVREGTAQAQIAAWIVVDDAPPPLRTLRQHLAERLPDYMIPASILVVGGLPTTRNGKVDYARLLAGDSAGRTGNARSREAEPSAAAFGEAERVLLDIWRELLDAPDLGPHDNVLEFGGDSIVSIRVVGRARAAGWKILPSQMFDHPTVAGLARVAERCAAADDEPLEDGSDVPLSPIQRWFVERAEATAANRACVTRLLQLSRRIGATEVEAALRRVVGRHDALRLRLRRGADGWRQTVASEEPHPIVTSVDVAGLPSREHESAVTSAGAACLARIDAADGPLIQAVLLTAGDRPPSLFIAIHHLGADHVSWGTILRDLEAAIVDPNAPESPAPSFARWARHLAKRAASGAFDADARYWLDTCADATAFAWTAAPSNGEPSKPRLLVELDADDTRVVVHEMHAAYNTTVVDALLTALAAVLSRGGDPRPVLVDLESTGRELDGEIADGVGWFTALYPVSLPTEAGEPGVRRLVRVKEALRRVPGDGSAFGGAKYLSANEDLRRALTALPRPAVAFNYLGHVAAELRRDGLLAPLPGSFGRLRHVGALGHQLEVNALIVDERLVVEFAWAPALDLRKTVSELADAFVEALRSLAAQCRAASGPGATPSDFPLVTLDEAALAALVAEVARGDEAES